jgi:adenosine deaminase
MFSRRSIIGAALGAPLLASLPYISSDAVASPDAPGAPSADDMARFIAGMPKAEYHVHLEGTLEAEMKFALARRNGMTLPYADVAAMKRSYIYHDLPSFLAIYYEGNSVLRQEQDFYDLCHAYLTKAAAQNILYAEMFFDPQSHTDRGIAIGVVIAGIARAQADARRTLGIESRLILCFMRDLSAQSAMSTLDAALPFKQHLVGVGLDSDEKGNPPGKFAAVFAKARAAGLKLTMHCDVNQENSLANIRQVIEEIGVDRIDHGGNILQSPELMALAKSRNMSFTVCPTFSGEVKIDGQAVDVVRGMLDNGLNVTINSDDPAYMGSEYLNAVLVRAQARSPLTKPELIRIERNAFHAGWMSDTQRAGFLARLDGFARTSGVAS